MLATVDTTLNDYCSAIPSLLGVFISFITLSKLLLLLLLLPLLLLLLPMLPELNRNKMDDLRQDHPFFDGVDQETFVHMAVSLGLEA